MPEQRDLQTAHERRAQIIDQLQKQATKAADSHHVQLIEIEAQIAKALRRQNARAWLFAVGVIFWGLAILFVSYLIARGL
jgi:hypothetical protein